MVLEVGKALSFLVSLMSLVGVMGSAFFVPGTRWEERLGMALVKMGMAACVCLMSGLVFTWPAKGNPEAGRPLMETLPVRVMVWWMVGMAGLFLGSWYFAVYYVSLSCKNLPC